MASVAPRLALHGGPARPIARAVRAASLGRLDALDRRWVEMIEARRRRLLGDDAPTGPSFDT